MGRFSFSAPSVPAARLRLVPLAPDAAKMDAGLVPVLVQAATAVARAPWNAAVWVAAHSTTDAASGGEGVAVAASVMVAACGGAAGREGVRHAERCGDTLAAASVFPPSLVGRPSHSAPPARVRAPPSLPVSPLLYSGRGERCARGNEKRRAAAREKKGPRRARPAPSPARRRRAAQRVVQKCGKQEGRASTGPRARAVPRARGRHPIPPSSLLLFSTPPKCTPAGAPPPPGAPRASFGRRP